MKLSLIAVSCLLIGCAHGVADEVSQEPDVTVETKLPPPRAPEAFEADNSEEGPPPIKCHIDAYEAGNCIVVNIYCEGKPVQVEISCHGPPLWPWEEIPDPPYDQPGNRE